MSVLRSKLYERERQRQAEEAAQYSSGDIEASWGNQVRSYVFHPYQLVKDLRTDVETSHIEDVLDGDLDDFVAAELKQEA